MVYREWNVKSADKTIVQQISENCGIPQFISNILVSRGFTTPEQVKSFTGTECDFSSPMLMKDMEVAAERIRSAVDNGERIVVYGDYDVDGVCATALMYIYLDSIGADVYYKLPNRAENGYGLSKDIIDLMEEKAINLIITVDNGISAFEEITYAAQKGIDVVVTDHHLPPEVLPPAVAIVNPLQKDDKSPAKNLAGVGVAFKVICGIEGCEPYEMLDFYADLVAIGTVADIMPLSGENRGIVRRGVEIINNTTREGLAALIEVAGLSEKTITSENLGFGIGPRINAAGRMEDATAALKLLVTEDEDEAATLAAQLEECNLQRRQTEKDIIDKIIEKISQDITLQNQPVIVVWGEGYHNGVIGIVASRLVEKFGRPSIVLSVEGDVAKGSGRSIKGFSLYTAISECSDLLERFGGHDLAAGMSLKTDKLIEFSEKINAFAAEKYPFIGASPLEIDAVVSLRNLEINDVKSLSLLEPFGSKNPSPIFLIENAVLETVYSLSDGKHCRLKLKQGAGQIFAAMFGVSPNALAYKAGDILDVTLAINVFEGKNGDMLSGRVVAIRPAGIGNEYVKHTELYRSFLGGVPLDKVSKQELLPSREEAASVYRLIKSGAVIESDLSPIFAKLKELNAGKILVSLDAFLSLGLIEKTDNNGVIMYQAATAAAKCSLGDADIMKALSE